MTAASTRTRKALAAAACLMLLTAGVASPAEPPPPRLGQQVPDFAMFDQQGRLHRLSEVTSPVIVLNFWAFWCDTWKVQLPQLRELAGRQQELNFRLLAISVDGQWADAQRAYLKGQKLDFTVLLDGRKTLATALGIRRVPTVLVLNRERKVMWMHEAYPGNPVVLKAIRGAAGRSGSRL